MGLTVAADINCPGCEPYSHDKIISNKVYISMGSIKLGFVGSSMQAAVLPLTKWCKGPFVELMNIFLKIVVFKLKYCI